MLTELLIVLAVLAGIAIAGVCLWGVNQVLDSLDPDQLDHYHERPYQ